MTFDQAAVRRQARIMRVVNVPMRAALSLPFATPISARVILISYTGLKSGKAYRLPVAYVRDGGELLTLGGGRWTYNLLDGQPARIRPNGRDLPVQPEAVIDPAGVERLIDRIAEINPGAGKYVPIKRRPDGLNTAVRRGYCVIRWLLPEQARRGLGR